MASLLEKMKAFEIKSMAKAKTFTETDFFTETSVVASLNVPIINLAFSGKLDGGIPKGITILAGDTQTFKTLLSLLCMKTYLEAYNDGVGIIYDSEFGITPDYLQSLGLDTSRILHIPVENIENVRFDMVNRLETLKKGDHVFFMLDSLGLLSSKKESQDTKNLKSVADMSRAKEIRALFRGITSKLSMKQLPFFVINHFYETQDFKPKKILSGGKAVILAANQAFIITKVSIYEKVAVGEDEDKKTENNVIGTIFKLNTIKSRFVRNMTQFPFIVEKEIGIYKNSGLFDLALEAGVIKKVTPQKYSINDSSESYKRVAIEENNDLWKKLVKDEKLIQFVEKKYKLGENLLGEDNTSLSKEALAMIGEDEEEGLGFGNEDSEE